MSRWHPDWPQVSEVMKKVEGIFPPVEVWAEEGKKGPAAPPIDSRDASSGALSGFRIVVPGSGCSAPWIRIPTKIARAAIPATADVLHAPARASRPAAS